MFTRQLGRRVQELRRDRGMTQDDLSDKAGLSYSTVSKIERGAIREPSVQTMMSIAHALSCSLDELVSSRPEKVEPKPAPAVSFVYLDVNGVLVRFFQRAFTRLGRDTGVMPDLIETTFWHHNDAVCTGKMTITEFNRKLAAKLGVKRIDWQKYYMDAIEPVKEAHQLARTLRKQGIKIGLLTNIFPGFLEVMTKKKLLPDIRFNVVAESSAAGGVKPNRRIYDYAAQKAGVPPEEILFIDDARANLIYAERLGWQVMWFDLYHPNESVNRVKKRLNLEN